MWRVAALVSVVMATPRPSAASRGTVAWCQGERLVACCLRSLAEVL